MDIQLCTFKLIDDWKLEIRDLKSGRTRRTVNIQGYAFSISSNVMKNYRDT